MNKKVQTAMVSKKKKDSKTLKTRKEIYRGIRVNGKKK